MHSGDLYKFIRTNAENAKARDLSKSFYWDGRRFWIWNAPSNRFVSYRITDFRLHLRCDGVNDVEEAIAEVKRNWRIDGALSVALHAAGDVIVLNGKKLLCTRNIRAAEAHSPGPFPIIGDALQNILLKDAEAFVRWIASAYRYVVHRIAIRPEIPCLIGSCNSAKGLISRITNMTLIESWRPAVYRGNRLGVFEEERTSNVLHLIDLSDMEPNKFAIKKLEAVLNGESERFGKIDLVIPQIFMVRCHDTKWQRWEARLSEIGIHSALVFKTAQQYSIQKGKKRMDVDSLSKLIKSELPHFREHFLKIQGQNEIP